MTRAKPLRHTATQPTAFDTATMDLHASRSSRTYAMPERSDHLDFYIRDQTSRPAITDAHKHEYFQIQINLGGDTQQYIGEVVRPFPRGAVALILPHRVHRIPHPEESRFIVVNFSFEFLLGRRLPVEEEAGAIRNEPVFAPFLLQERMDFMLSEPQIAEVESLTAHMLILDRQRQFGDTILLRAYLLQLIGMICTSHRDMIQALVAARSPARQESVFARLSGYLHAHLSDPSFSAASLAALMSLSSRYVGDLVKRETGKSVVQWITQTRIEEAKRLLLDHRRQIKDIAFEVGYRDEAYFTRRFRQLTGVSPSAYRDGA